jgi:hypothetical protein
MLCLAIVVTVLVFTSACDPVGIQAAADRIGQAIDELSQDFSQFQVTLTKLEQDLVKSGQSLIANEVTQLLQRGVGTGGSEIRCDADFLGHRMQEGLQRIKDALLRKPPQPLRQFFCQVVPTTINLALSPDRRPELDFFGFNLDSGRATVFVKETNGNQRTVQNPQSIIATPTPYLMTVNLSPVNGLALGPNDQQIVVVLNPGLPSQDPHPVDVIAPAPPAMFSIVDHSSSDHPGGGGVGGSAPGPVRRQCPVVNGPVGPLATVGVGVQGRNGNLMDQLQLVCATLNPDGSLGSQVSLPADGGGGGDPFALTCPAGQALVGFSGRSSGNLERISLQCNLPASVVGQTGVVTTVGPSKPGGGGSTFTSACEPQGVVTGLIVRSGGDPDLVIRMDFICSKVQLQ